MGLLRVLGILAALAVIGIGLTSFESLEAGEPGGVVEANDRMVASDPVVRLLDPDGAVTELALMLEGHRVRTRSTDAVPVTDYSVRVFSERNGEPGFQPGGDSSSSSWSGTTEPRLDGGFGAGEPNTVLAIDVMVGGSRVERRVGAPMVVATPAGEWFDLAVIDDLGLRLTWMRDGAGQLHVRCVSPSAGRGAPGTVQFNGRPVPWFEEPDMTATWRVVVPLARTIRGLRAVVTVTAPDALEVELDGVR